MCDQPHPVQYAAAPARNFGRYDAGYGLMLLGTGDGSFEPSSLPGSGFLVKGEGRAIAKLRLAGGGSAYLVARYGESALLFR